MNTHADKVASIAANLELLLEASQGAIDDRVATSLEVVRSLQGTSGDPRLQRLAAELRCTRHDLAELAQLLRDGLAKTHEEANLLAAEIPDGRLGRALLALVDHGAAALKPLCQALLDAALEATGAERGFVALYVPETTEASVVAVRDFQTLDLSLEEYSFSSTVLREVLQSGEPLLVDDASIHPQYALSLSVRKLCLRSIALAPLKQRLRTLGAVYVEDRRHAAAFEASDLRVLCGLARFAVFCLSQSHQLPAAPSTSHVYLDSRQAEIVTAGEAMRDLLQRVRQVADHPAVVLIQGETGSGKDLIARAIHESSRRHDHPFVAVNCAAIPENLLESELFGYEKGAFTGADERRAGRIQRASGGTLFLDEIQELPRPLQAKLLRFLDPDRREVQMLGGPTLQVDARVVTASSSSLKALMDEGKLDPAFYYRVAAVTLNVAPLRERKGDIPALVEHFLTKLSKSMGRRFSIDPAALDVLMDYSFPGNVRELRGILDSATAFAPTDVIRVGDLPPQILNATAQRVSLEPFGRLLREPLMDLPDLARRRERLLGALDALKKGLAERLIREADGNKTKAAELLGLSRQQLYEILKDSAGESL